MSLAHSWLCGGLDMTPDWESVQIQEFLIFWKEKPSLISLILNTKS